MLDEYTQSRILESTLHGLQLKTEAFIETQREMQRPSTIYRPHVSMDGNQWCFLYGENLQDGVAGFGDTPALAAANFDQNWFNEKIPTNR